MSEETYRIAEWLARAADTPERAHDEWATQGVTLLRCGRAFGVICIPGVLADSWTGVEFGTDDLRFALGGPVFHRPDGPYWVLIHGHAGLVWDEGDDVPSLGDDHYLGVPSLTRTQPPGTHWVVPPRYDGDVCRPATVRKFIAQARQKLIPLEA